MKFDLSLSPFDADVSALVSAARMAESEGFDAIWTYDHISGVSEGAGWVLDPWVVLSAIAAGTHRIGLGPLVLNAPVRHPAHIAVAAATLQDLSEGRLMLGLGAGAGAGSYATELRMVGLPDLSATDRRARTEGTVAAVRALWRGEPLPNATPQHLIAASAFRRPEPEPPIVIGANGPKMAALAGRAANAVNFHWFEDDLEGLADIARTASGDLDFEVTVEAPLEAHWLIGEGRSRLESLGATRVMYRWDQRLGNESIARAAGMLRAG